MAAAANTDQPRVLYVVSHTHWDREWHAPLQRFRLRLVELLDHLLTILEHEPAFAHFHLDSQTIVLEDYLEVYPQRESDLRRWIGSGRIAVGPWYVLSDTFLTSGEATIRNLLLGRRQAERFGRVGSIGYLPDQFGNIGQLPQILRSFGIADAVVGRGVSAADVPIEFTWVAPDGSTVLCSLLHGWYNNAQRLAPVPRTAAGQLRAAAAHLRPLARSSALLLMNGVDHLEPQEDLAPILEAAAPLLAPDRVEHAGLADYFAAVRADLGAAAEATGGSFAGRPIAFRGELRQQWHRHAVLNGTLSARMYLKLANHRCQLALERQAEPWIAIAGLLGEAVPRGPLATAWRYLMQNHPHDSICGCSADAVHQDMEARFRHVDQIATELIRRARLQVGRRIRAALPDGTAPDGAARVAFAVFNDAAQPRDGLCATDIDFAPGGSGGRLRLRDAATGAVVPCAVLHRGPGRFLVADPAELPRARRSDRFRVRLLARDLPGFGYRTLLAERLPGPPFSYGSEQPPRDAGLAVRWPSEDGGAGGRNRHLDLRIAADGSFSLRLAAENGAPEQVFSGLGLLLDDGEAGDSYLHAPPAADRVICGFDGAPRIELAAFGPDWFEWSISGTMRLPASLDPERQGRVAETVAIPVALRLTLVRDARRLDLEVRLDNRARDHRLRILFPAGVQAPVARAAGQFDVVTRPTALRPDWEALGNHPAEQWVDLSIAGRGLAVLLDGTPEYGVEPGEGGQALAVTLLRCTDVLGDNPGFDPVPGAQCAGPITMRFGLVPHRGDLADADLYAASAAFQLPPVAVQLDAPLQLRRYRSSPLPEAVAGDADTPVHNRFLAPEPAADLPPVHGFLEWDAKGAVFSALKPAESGQGVIVRAFHPGDGAATVRISLRPPMRLASAARCNLAEDEPVPLELADGATVDLDLGAHQIGTLHLGGAAQDPAAADPVTAQQKGAAR